MESQGRVGQTIQDQNDKENNEWKIAEYGNFSYTDPIDGTKAENQGPFLKSTNDDKMILRLSEIDSVHTTLHLYLFKLEKNPEKLNEDPQEHLQPFFSAVTENILKIKETIGDTNPSIKLR